MEKKESGPKQKKICEQCGNEYWGQVWQKICVDCWRANKEEEANPEKTKKDDDKKFNVVDIPHTPNVDFGEKDRQKDIRIWRQVLFKAAADYVINIEYGKIPKSDLVIDRDEIIKTIFWMAEAMEKKNEERKFITFQSPKQ
jgi:hypothetical protein